MAPKSVRTSLATWPIGKASGLCGDRSPRPLHPGGGRFLDQTALLAAKRIHRQCKAKGKRFEGREASFKINQNHSSFAGDASGNPGDGGNPARSSFSTSYDGKPQSQPARGKQLWNIYQLHAWGQIDQDLVPYTHTHITPWCLGSRPWITWPLHCTGSGWLLWHSWLLTTRNLERLLKAEGTQTLIELDRNLRLMKRILWLEPWHNKSTQNIQKKPKNTSSFAAEASWNARDSTAYDRNKWNQQSEI